MKKLTDSDCYKIINPIKKGSVIMTFSTIAAVIISLAAIAGCFAVNSGEAGMPLIMAIALPQIVFICEIVFISTTTAGCSAQKREASLLWRCSPNASRVVKRAFICDEIRRAATFFTTTAAVFTVSLYEIIVGEINISVAAALCGAICAGTAGYFGISAFVYLLRSQECSFILSYIVVMVGCILVGIAETPVFFIFTMEIPLPVMIVITLLSAAVAALTGALNCRASIKRVLKAYYEVAI